MPGATTPRCGVVGAGRTRQGLGPYLVRDLEAHGARVDAIVGRDPARTRALAAEFAARYHHPVKAYQSTAAMVAAGALDAVVIATPIASHRESLVATAASDLAVLCEKPLVAPEQHHLVPELLAAFENRLLMENCQWPYMLPALEQLHPGVCDSPPELIEMRLSPMGSGRAMLVDSLSHFLSVLQDILPVTPATEFGRIALSDRGAAVSALELAVEIHKPFPPVRAVLYLVRCVGQPRPAWVAVNGKRAERRIRTEDYSMKFFSGDRSVAIADPLTALVGAFVKQLREPNVDRIRDEADAVRERARLYAEIFEHWPA